MNRKKTHGWNSFSTKTSRFKAFFSNRWFLFSLRIILGSIFLSAGLSKLLNQPDFSYAIASYTFLPDNLTSFLDLILPWIEVFLGLLLILGILIRPVSGIMLILIFGFIYVNALALIKNVAGSCGCFSNVLPISHSQSLFLDLGMLIFTIPLLCISSNFLRIAHVSCHRRHDV